MFVGFINNFCQEILGEKYWRTFAPYLGTIGLYLLFANLSGLFGVGTAHQRFECDSGLGDHEPGADLRFPVPLSRLGGGLKKFGQPSVIITPLNVMEVGIRPLALCMRLFGNILGGFIIMELIKTVAPAVVPVPFSLYFDIFDGVLQAVVFVFLTTLFLSESLE